MSMLPALATARYPTITAVYEAFDWYKRASEKERAQYVAARLAVVRNGPKDDFLDMHSSGTTGKQKHYKWGPGFNPINIFFYNLVQSGTRLKKAAWLRLGLTSTMRDNQVAVTSSHVLHCHSIVGVTVRRKALLP